MIPGNRSGVFCKYKQSSRV